VEKSEGFDIVVEGGRAMATSTAASLPITIGSPEFAADPLSHYAWLREHAPVAPARFEYGPLSQDAWVVARYADCRAALSDPRLLRSPGGEGPALAAGLPEHVRLMSVASLIMKDEPEHKRLRSLVAKPFTPKMIERLGERVRGLAHERLDALAHRDVVDLREEFALPVPFTVIAEMVGVDDTDRRRFRDGIAGMLSGFTGSRDELEARMSDLVDLTRDLVARKRAEPAEDIVSGLVQAEEEGDRLTDDEVVAMVFTLVAAGYETTYNLITNAVVTLLDHPDALAALRAAPADLALWRSAVEEVVRHSGPVGGTKPLTATEDIAWHGQTVPAGATLFPLLASANRDPEAFAEPDRFDITRSPNHHLGFGHGIHFCLGANLARMETRVALQVLLDRHPRLALAVRRDELALEPMPLWTRYRELPVRLG
jgi:cytochrome P450